MKKVAFILICLFCGLVSLNAYADFSATWDDDGKLSIDAGENETGVIVTNRLNEILYINQGSGIFKTNIKNQSEIKINLGDSVTDTVYGDILGKKSNIIYVSPKGNDSNDGTLYSPLLTVSAALAAADTGDTVKLLGEVAADSVDCGKNVVISGGILDISQNESFSLSGDIELSDITLKNAPQEKIIISGSAKIGKNAVFKNDADIECGGNIRIESGNYNNITVNNSAVYILPEVSIKSKIYTNDSSMLVFEGCDFSKKLNESIGKIFILGKNGTVKKEEKKIKISPEDERAYSVNGEEYITEGVIPDENGVYRIDFEYNVKLHSVGVSQNNGTYKLTVASVNNNLNNEVPIVRIIAAVYGKDGILKEMTSGEYDSKNITMQYSSAKMTANDTIKIFVWDSFKRLVPLAGVSLGTVSELTAAKKEFYVSPSGNDANPGTITAPFATLKKAQSAARLAGEGTTVYFREGEYYFPSKCNFTSSDSGITYKAYNGEKAVFTTVKSMKGSMFEEVPQDIKNRIKNENAKKKVLRVKLDESGFGSIPEIEDRSYSNKAINPILFSDSKRMTLARYPDSGYIHVTSVIDSGVTTDKSGNISERRPIAFSSDELAGKMSEWGDSDGFYIFGYLGADWSDAFYKCNFDGDKNVITANANSGYAIRKDDRFYCANILEEINSEGEWCFDRENNYIYIYPFADFNEESKIKYNVRNTSLDSFINIKGAENLVFNGIVFDGISANDYCINISDYCDGVVIKNCEFTNLVCKAALIKKSENCRIEGNYAHDLSRGVFVIDGGDAKTLTPGQNEAVNNKIERFAQENTTYEPAIALYGVGNKASHNEISDSAHMAIGFYGQKCIIEYNEIYNVCNDTLDSGAIYAGLTFTAPGNIMRFNYIHDIENKVKEMTGTATTVVGIYFDERLSGEYVYSNVFENIDRACFIGSGRYNTIEKNVMINCPQSVYISRYWTFNESLLDGLKIYENNALWQKEFPWIGETANDEPKDPKYNRVNDNALYNSALPQIPEKYSYLLDPTGNVIFDSTDIFADYDNKDFSILAKSDIYKEIPGFGVIPFGEIGLTGEKGETR